MLIFPNFIAIHPRKGFPSTFFAQDAGKKYLFNDQNLNNLVYKDKFNFHEFSSFF